jgi:hypothetical protein
VAKLVGRPNYEELVKIYRTSFKNDSSDYYLLRFEALLRWLAERNVDDLLRMA